MPADLAHLFRRDEGTRIAAVINVSPESFHAASVAEGEEAVARVAREAEAAGADLLDIGAMSTAPYKETEIGEDEEAERMERAVRAARAASSLPISADTQRAAVAEVALRAGARIVNDVSGLENDPRLLEVVARSDAGLILMASEAATFVENGEAPAQVVRRILYQMAARATDAGVPAECLILDPGVGFFRNRSVPWYEWDLALLQNLKVFKSLGYPVMVGASRKSLFKGLLGRERTEDRLAGSLAVAGFCAARGVEWLRVHDVAETRDAVRMTRMMLGLGV